MGEYSKRIGQIGEELVWNFLNRIGWTSVQRNFDIPSIDPEKHGKKSHGIDGLFSYKSPMIANTLENTLISSKFSSNRYPNNPVADFKSYYDDIASGIESFKRSSLRQEITSSFSGTDSTFDRGIIFWLNNHSDDDKNITQSLTTIINNQKYRHDGVFLVDNRRVGFIYDTLNYADLTFDNCTVEFYYFQTGQNNDDLNKRNGEIMPVQFFTSSILPLRVQNNLTQETTILISSIERFDATEFVKLMGMAKSLGNNAQVNTVICFPDYTTSEHEQFVDRAKQALDDVSFTKRLSITSYNDILRG